MSHVEDPQGELPLTRGAKVSGFPVSNEMVRACRTPGEAISLAVRASGLDPKEVFIPLRIDAGTWSKICSDQATFPAQKIRDFCELVENRIYVEFVAYQVGCTAVMIKSEAERQIDELKARLQERDHENAVLLKAIRAGAAS